MPRQRRGQLRRMEVDPTSWVVHPGVAREKASFKDEVFVTGRAQRCWGNESAGTHERESVWLGEGAPHTR